MIHPCDMYTRSCEMAGGRLCSDCALLHGLSAVAGGGVSWWGVNIASSPWSLMHDSQHHREVWAHIVLGSVIITFTRGRYMWGYNSLT